MIEYIRWERDKVHHQYADMLGRIRSGCRISWKAGEFRVHDEWGKITMMTADPSKALNRYFFQCSLATRQAELVSMGKIDSVTPWLAKW